MQLPIWKKRKPPYRTQCSGAGTQAHENFHYSKSVERQAGADLHGWVYSLYDGVINPIYHLKANTAIDPLYRYDDL